MKYLLNILKILGGLAFFLIALIVGLRFTLDLDELKPELEQMLSLASGGDVELKGLELSGIIGVKVDSAELTYPMTPEQEKEWEQFRAYLKELRRFKAEGGVEPEVVAPPAQALKLCLQSTNLSVNTTSAISLLLGGEIAGELNTRVLSCGEPESPLQDQEPKHLRVEFDALWPLDPVTREINLTYQLSEVDLADVEALRSRLPVDISGLVTLDGKATVALGRRWQLLIRKSTGEAHIEISGLANTKGVIGPMFELPALRFGQLTAKLKLDKGRLDFVELTTRGDEFSGVFTGFLKPSGVFSRSRLDLHIAMSLSPEFVNKNADIRSIALLQRKYFHKRPDKGYDVGVLLKGKVSRLRPSAAKNSPYSKAGRSSEREGKRKVKTRTSRRVQRKRTPPRPTVSKAKTQATSARRAKSSALKRRPRPKRSRVKTKPRKSSRRRPSRDDTAEEIDEGEDVGEGEGEGEEDSEEEEEGEREGEREGESDGDDEDEDASVGDEDGLED